MKKEKILYIIHVDWNWIKQRPHFIAEGLAASFDVKIIYPHVRHHKSYKKAGIVNGTTNLSIHKLYELPLRGRSKLVGWINKLYIKLYYRLIIFLFRPDIVWMGFPNHIKYLPSLKNYRVVYDCMDNAAEFFRVDQSKKKEILKLEKELVAKASAVFVSSLYLQKVLERRYPEATNKLSLVRNAFNGKVANVSDTKTNKNNNYKVGYIGTISSWFDFESLLYCLEKVKNVEFHLIGPTECEIKSYNHERLKFYGAINHDDLESYVQNFDALIMPFKINELILSVDPVKLYEYINFNKPILSIYYDEIERFSEFVHFYNNSEELAALLDNPTESLKATYNDKQRMKFLKLNRWENRVYDMEKTLSSFQEKVKTQK